MILTLIDTVSLPSNVNLCKLGFKYKSYKTGFTDFGSRLKVFLVSVISKFSLANVLIKFTRKHLQKNRINESLFHAISSIRTRVQTYTHTLTPTID